MGELGIYGMNPDQLFRGNWHAVYERQLEVIWLQLVRLNTTLHITDRLNRFRADLFIADYDSHFFEFTINNNFEVAILCVYRLLEDRKRTSLGLGDLEKGIRQNFKSQDFLREFQERLGSVQRQTNPSEVIRRIKHVRHNQIAHFNRYWNSVASLTDRQKQLVYLKDLSDARDYANSLFEAMCFGGGRSLLPIGYSQLLYCSPGLDPRDDIERMLDLIAQNSAILNMPEKDPDYWAFYREAHLTSRDLDIVNAYRSKIGLPAV